MNNDQLNQEHEESQVNTRKYRKAHLKKKSTETLPDEPIKYICSYNTREAKIREPQISANIDQQQNLNFVENLDISGKLFDMRHSANDLTAEISKVHIKDCIVSLTNPMKTYFVGETIQGFVIINFDGPKVIRTIYTYVLGEVFIKIGMKKTTDVFHRGKKQYLEGDLESDQITMPSGIHKYRFAHTLPLNIPSTYKGGKYGCILYTLLVIMNRSWKENQAFKIPITVIDQVNLRRLPKVRDSVTLHLKSNSSFWSCHSLPASVKVFIPRSGYVCGQKIDILCECDNASKCSVHKISFKLCQVVSYKLSKTVESHKSVTKKSIWPLKLNALQTYRLTLEIPNGLTTSILNCKHLSLNYELKVVCYHLLGNLFKFMDIIPITLGNIPAKSYTSLSEDLRF